MRLCGDSKSILVTIGVVVLLIVLLFVGRIGYNENYCCGEQVYSDPEFPTYDHYGTNKWVRYNVSSDNFPFSPYYPSGPYDF